MHLIGLAALVWVVVGGQENGCLDFILIDNPKRSTSYKMAETDTPINDYYIIVQDKWYRFQSYGMDVQILELNQGEAIPAGHCGTQSPIWISGLNSHPTDDSIKSATICLSYGIGWCDWNSTISIARCQCGTCIDVYFVYQLQRPNAAQIAYCAGDQIPCPPGQRYNPVMDTCVDNHPAMDAFPTLSGPTIYQVQNETPYFFFSCNVYYTTVGPNDNAKFKVTFTFNGHIDKSEDPGKKVLAVPDFYVDSSNRVAVLPDRFLRGRLGQWIGCMVQSFWGASPDILSDVLNGTNSYWAGIRVDGEIPVVLTTSEPQKRLSLTPTVPILCPSFFQSCVYSVVIFSGNMNTKTCSYTLYNRHWIGYSGTPLPQITDLNRIDVTPFPQTTSVIASSNIIFEPIKSVDINFPEIQFFPVWSEYLLSPVPVHVSKESSSNCRIYWDPHIVTFDDRRYSFNEYGDFYLWTSSSPRVFEVQISIWRELHYNTAVACGVAMREGNHVLGVTMCLSRQGSNGKFPVQLIEYLRSADPRKGAIVKTNSWTYEIRMPSGSKVLIQDKGTWLNIYAYPTDEDRAISSGLCGNYDGNANNDQTSGFRVSLSESFFTVPAPKCKDYETAIAPPCECNNPDDGPKDIRCDVSKISNTIKSKYFCPGTQRRKRASEYSATVFFEEYDDNVLEDDYIFHEVPRSDGEPPMPAHWPTPGGITEQEAIGACEQSLLSSNVYYRCQTYIDLALLHSNCINDIQLADTFNVTEGYRDVMEMECHMTIEASLTLTSVDPELQENELDVLRDLERYICPNHCSEKGTCVNGTCLCQEGYTNDDCSLLIVQQPTISFLRNNGLCDRRQRPCQSARMFVEDIDQTQIVTCSIASKAVVQDTDLQIGDTHYDEAVVVTNMEIVCTLPPSPVMSSNRSTEEKYAAVTYRLAISNNGVNFSSEVEMTVYDSLCIECNGKNNCQEKMTACHIDGHCASSNDINPDNVCVFCDLANSRTSWTERKDIQKPILTSGNYTEFFKYEGESLEAVLPFADPQSFSVTCQLSSPVHGVMVSSQCQLKWDAEGNLNQTVMVQLTNKCGVASLWALDLIVYATSWSVWGEWDNCSRDCDPGVQTRSRTCLSSAGCYNASSRDLMICSLGDCEAKPGEENEGAIFSFWETDLSEVLFNTHALYDSVAVATNNYCSEFGASCCQLVDAILEFNNANMSLASGKGCSIAAGFPITVNQIAQVKIILTLSRNTFQQQCTFLSHRTRRSADLIYFDSQMLTEAIQNAQGDIEQAIGVKVVSINSGAATYSTESTSSNLNSTPPEAITTTESTTLINTKTPSESYEVTNIRATTSIGPTQDMTSSDSSVVITTSSRVTTTEGTASAVPNPSSTISTTVTEDVAHTGRIAITGGPTQISSSFEPDKILTTNLNAISTEDIFFHTSPINTKTPSESQEVKNSRATTPIGPTQDMTSIQGSVAITATPKVTAPKATTPGVASSSTKMSMAVAEAFSTTEGNDNTATEAIGMTPPVNTATLETSGGTGLVTSPFGVTIEHTKSHGETTPGVITYKTSTSVPEIKLTTTRRALTTEEAVVHTLSEKSPDGLTQPTVVISVPARLDSAAPLEERTTTYASTEKTTTIWNELSTKIPVLGSSSTGTPTKVQTEATTTVSPIKSTQSAKAIASGLPNPSSTISTIVTEDVAHTRSIASTGGTTQISSSFEPDKILTTNLIAFTTEDIFFHTSPINTKTPSESKEVKNSRSTTPIGPTQDMTSTQGAVAITATPKVTAPEATTPGVAPSSTMMSMAVAEAFSTTEGNDNTATEATGMTPPVNTATLETSGGTGLVTTPFGVTIEHTKSHGETTPGVITYKTSTSDPEIKLTTTRRALTTEEAVVHTLTEKSPDGLTQPTVVISVPTRSDSAAPLDERTTTFASTEKTTTIWNELSTKIPVLGSSSTGTPTKVQTEATTTVSPIKSTQSAKAVNTEATTTKYMEPTSKRTDITLIAASQGMSISSTWGSSTIAVDDSATVLSRALIAGIIVAALFVGALFTGIVIWKCRPKKSPSTASDSDDSCPDKHLVFTHYDINKIV